MNYLTASCFSLLIITSCQNQNSFKFSPPPPTKNDSALKPAIVLSDSGWISLSDGVSLIGWHTYGKKTAGSAWNTDSFSIHLKPGLKNGYQTMGGGDLVTNDTYGNFDLKLEWKIARKANSGIMIFVQEDTLKYKETWNTGPEMQVCDKDSNEDAHSLKHEAGDLYDLISSTEMSAKPALEWNQVEMVSNNNRLDLYLNDVHIISTVLWGDHWKKLIAASKFKTMPGFGSFHSGHIALQDHGEEVWYRNIRIKKI
ncbi:MAG TPA: DUF1080 domain-containing protein [Puia sp.]